MPWFLPILIFFARLADVSLGTIRIISVVRGKMIIAALLGFAEVSIWVLAISGTLKYLSNPLALISYASGFAVGNVLGIYLERLLVHRYRTVRVMNTDPEIHLANYLRTKGYAVTEMKGKGKYGSVEICLITIPRTEFRFLEEDIQENAPKSFITVEDVLDISGGVRSSLQSQTPSWLGARKGI